MTQIESFVNTDDSLRPLEMVSRVAPVTCFEAAFHAAVAAMLVNHVVDWWKQGHRHRAGGHFAGSSESGLAAVPSGTSSDGLVELLAQRF
jgi:hypothetical protein